MRLNQLDYDILDAAAREGFGAWRPWYGSYGRAKTLARSGLLREAGIAAMPPHVVYVVTKLGFMALKAKDRAPR